MRIFLTILPRNFLQDHLTDYLSQSNKNLLKWIEDNELEYRLFSVYYEFVYHYIVIELNGVNEQYFRLNFGNQLEYLSSRNAFYMLHKRVI